MAALMSQAAFHIVRPNEKLRFQYTTSSSSLQKNIWVILDLLHAQLCLTLSLSKDGNAHRSG